MTSLATNFRFVIIATNKHAQVLKNQFTLKLIQKYVQPFRLSSSTSKTESWSKNLSYVTTSRNSLFDNNDRPIVLLYSWLLAKKRNIRHYSEIYAEKGFDILQVRISPYNVLWPKSTNRTIVEIGDFLTSTPGRPILVHGFSVGGFIHTELLHHMMNADDLSKNEEVFRRLKGQIFDSVVDVIGVPEGVSTALFLNQPVLQKITEDSINGYLKFVEKPVSSVYRRSSKIFHANSLRIPSLMLYSTCDPIGSVGPIESAIKNWQEKGIPVMSKRWEDTPHVGHFRAHKDEYIAYVNTFLDSIGLGDKAAGSSVDPRSIPSNHVPIDIPVPVTQVPDKAIDTPTDNPKVPDVLKRKIFASNKPAL